MIIRALRAIAIAIAIAGAIDPAITLTRRTKPEIAVVTVDTSAASLATRVADALDGDFTVIEAPYPGASATVIVGTAWPASASDLASPVFAVVPGRAARPSVTLHYLRAPSRATLDARIPVAAGIRVSGAAGRSVEITLRMNELVVDRATRELSDDDVTLELPLSFVPGDTGSTPIRVVATVVGTPDTAIADLAIDVSAERWHLLFFDPRPSWMSTFVRRSIEHDPRFVVTSRIITSRDLSTDVGRPPRTLGDADALAPFDAVVVGAPGELRGADVAGLDAYARRRGGTVVLLFDQRASGESQRLVGGPAWDRASSSAGLNLSDATGDSVALRASEIIWPRVLPAGARPIATHESPGGGAGDARAAVWQIPAGAGRVIVSGALDAWRFRDPSASGFERFWRTTIAAAAAASPRALDIQVERGVLRPGERTAVRATVREAALAPLPATGSLSTSIIATLETPAGDQPVRMWPSGAVGQFTGVVRAPTVPGRHRLTVATAGARAEASIVVGATASRATPDEREVVAAWVQSRGGTTVSATELGELARRLGRGVEPAVRRETWHPMRSPWWLLPFAIALGAEWLWRRQRGLR